MSQHFDERPEVGAQVHESSDTADAGSNQNAQTAVFILAAQVDDFDGHLGILSLDCNLLSWTAAWTCLDRRLFILLHKLVVFLTGRRVEQRFADEIQPAHLFVSP